MSKTLNYYDVIQYKATDVATKTEGIAYLLRNLNPVDTGQETWTRELELL